MPSRRLWIKVCKRMDRSWWVICAGLGFCADVQANECVLTEPDSGYILIAAVPAFVFGVSHTSIRSVSVRS